jgi:serine protease Do
LDARLSLPKNTVLGESYRIERVIGSGGFGITYVAEDIHLGTRVAIKEYCPEEFGQRAANLSVQPRSDRHKNTFEWGRASFLQEARTLARFRHSSIVQVIRVFESHSTAYMVMSFEQGLTFEVWLRGLGRSATQDELDRIAGPLLDALEMMHAQNFLHRDIAPDNIIVRADGTPVLLDFGAARHAVAEKSRTLTGIIKAGYSPHEQYAADARLQGPWTDLYAFGATFYRAVSGKPPEEATLRMTDDRLAPAADTGRGKYREGFLSAIDGCLKVRPSERPQSVAQMRPLLLAPSQAAIQTFIETSKIKDRMAALVRPASTTKQWWAVAAVLALVGGAYGGFAYTHVGTNDSVRVETEAKKAEEAGQSATFALAKGPKPVTLPDTAANTLERVMPAVVSIEVKTAPKRPDPSEQKNPSDPNKKSEPASQPSTAQGSGFIVSEDGLVATTYDVINSADSISVKFINGSHYSARLVGAHPASHLALLKIESTRRFPFVQLSKRNVVVGERVLAVGNPVGLGGSARSSTVSGWRKPGFLFESIELSPAFANGEAGAPLFDLAGAVVGVSYARTDAVGYAIPVNVAGEVINQLRRNSAVVDQAALAKDISKTRDLSSAPAGTLSIEIPRQLVDATRTAIVSINARAVAGSEARIWSGVLVSADGNVVTTHHAIDGANKIVVTQSSGQSSEAKVVGADPRTDIALLKVDGGDHLPFLEFAQKGLRVGDVVFSLGAATGADAVVSSGIVSSLSRDIGSGPFDYIQVDAKIERRDTGLPVLTLEGKIAAIYTSSLEPSGKPVGISFALPAEIVSRVSSELQTAGRVDRGWLGVKIQNMEEDVAASLGLSEAKGALISDVTPQGPAAEAGLQKGDAVLSVNGNRVADSRDFARQIAGFAPNTRVDLHIVRSQKEQTLAVMLGGFPSEMEQGNKVDLLGLTVALGNGEDAVVVTNVETASDAAQKGIKVGDVIRTAAGTDIRKPEDLANAVREIEKQGRKAILLLVKSGPDMRFIPLQLTKPTAKQH